MRVLFAVPQGPASPGPRYRVFQFLPGLERLGIRPDVLVMQGSRSTRRSLRSASDPVIARALHRVTLAVNNQLFLARVCAKAADYDRVFIYRIPISAWSRRRLARHRERLVYDFDDALDQAETDPGVWDRARASYLRSGLRNAVRACAVTVTSNARNAAVVRSLGGRAVVVPTSVNLDEAQYRDRVSLAGEVPLLGWIGTPSTAGYLRLVEGALLRVRERRRVAVRLVGAGGSPFTRLDVACSEWSLEAQAGEIARFDVGLMPMPDTPWTRGKAALKALEYGASGAPTVASWTPTNAEILGEQHGALLCRTENEWVSALLHLVDDAGLRSDLGRRARRLVESKFSLAKTLPKLHQAILSPSSAGAGADE